MADPLPTDKSTAYLKVEDKELSSSTLSASEFSGSESTLELKSKNPFIDPKVEEHYRRVYENASYECRHEFDPHFEWSAEEERKVLKKIDWRVCGWACVMFFALNIDRKNLPQAVSDNMLPQLGMTTNDYNYGNTIFLVSFLIAELPSQLVSKKLGPDRWIPMQMIAWSIVATCQAALTGRTSFFITRCLLGLLEGGFIADMVLWLSYFYTSTELPLRLSFFWTALNLTGVAMGLFAFAIYHMDGLHGIAGWRWLFLIEGLITLAVGIASIFNMPASAVATKAWWRPNGWFTDREVKIVVNRVLRDDPSKGDMHNRQAITPKGLWQAFLDYDLWPIYALGVIVYIPPNPPSTYLTLSLRNLGFSPINTNLLTIPSTAISCVTLIGLTWLSERVNERSLVASLQNIWILPCIIALRWWPGEGIDAWGTFALITTLLSYPYCHAILVAWTSRNSGSVRTRSVSAAFYNVTVQIGNVISANIYRADDAPLYHRGNTVLFALNVVSIAGYVLTKIYYIWKNKTREAVWSAMTQEQQDEYIATTKDEGNKRLDFRFAH